MISRPSDDAVEAAVLAYRRNLSEKSEVWEFVLVILAALCISAAMTCFVARLRGFRHQDNT